MWGSGRAWGHLLLWYARHSVHIVISYEVWIITILTLLLSRCQKLFKVTVGRGKIKGKWSSILIRIPALIRS